MRANDQWSFESERYMGPKGLDIIRHRAVRMLPKEKCEGIFINAPTSDCLIEGTPIITTLDIPFTTAWTDRLQPLLTSYRVSLSSLPGLPSAFLTVMIGLLIVYVPASMIFLVKLYVLDSS